MLASRLKCLTKSGLKVSLSLSLYFAAYLLEDLMEILAVSPLSTSSNTIQAQSNKAGAANFDEHLKTQLAAIVEPTTTPLQQENAFIASMVNVKIDQRDERAATAELLRLYKMLMSGKVDTSTLNNADTNRNVADGTNRKTLETLKAVIRRLIGMQGAENDNMNNFSVRELIKQLPDGVKDLLKKFFPDLEELLLKDEKNMASAAKT
jgi:hypothetical protein